MTHRISAFEQFTPCEACPAREQLEDRGISVGADFGAAVKSFSRTYKPLKVDPDSPVIEHVANQFEIPELSGEMRECAIARALGNCSMADVKVG